MLPGRICKEQRDGIAIATVKVNRVTYDPYQTKLIIKNKKKTTLSSCLLYGSPGRICKEQSDGIADLPANRVTTSGLRAQLLSALAKNSMLYCFFTRRPFVRFCFAKCCFVSQVLSTFSQHKKNLFLRTGFFMAPQVGFEPTTLRLTAECYYR